MQLPVAGHILAGAVGLGSGYIALLAAKGATLHRRSGLMFVFAMLAMSVLGITLAVWHDKAPGVNVPAGLLTLYLVVTSLATVRAIPAWSRPVAVGAMLVAAGVGLTMLTFGIESLAGVGGFTRGLAFPSFMFATVGLLAARGDVRVLRSGPPTGTRRLARHLWRMCFALFIGAISASVQVAKVLKRSGVHIPGVLLILPVLAVLVLMFYWLWRVRSRLTRTRAARRGGRECLAATSSRRY